MNLLRKSFSFVPLSPFLSLSLSLCVAKSLSVAPSGVFNPRKPFHLQVRIVAHVKRSVNELLSHFVGLQIKRLN